MKRAMLINRLPYLLLGAMTLVSLGGPFAVFLVIRGGLRPDWPPDRLVEWIVLSLVVALVLALFLACLTLGWWYSRIRQDNGPTPSDSSRAS